MVKRLLFKLVLVVFAFCILSLQSANTVQGQGTQLQLSCAYYTIGGTEYLCCQYFVYASGQWWPLGDPSWKKQDPILE